MPVWYVRTKKSKFQQIIFYVDATLQKLMRHLI